MIKKSLAALILTSTCISTTDAVEIESNIGITSNYIWRGISQSNNHASLSSGIELSNNGYYAGAWLGTVDFKDDTKFETNLFAGYRFKYNNIDWDFGAIHYIYHRNSPSNFSEIYATGRYKNFSFGVATLLESSDQQTDFLDNYYAHVARDWSLKNDVQLQFKAGHYQFPNANAYRDASISIGKGNLSFQYSKVFGLTNVDENLIAVSYQAVFGF